MQKQKQRQDELNTLAWLSGQYFISSIQVAFDPKKAKYPKQPFGQKTEETAQNPTVAARRFEDFAEAFNKKFENKQVDSTQ